MSAQTTLQTVYTALGASDATIKIISSDSSTITKVNNAAQIASITANYANALKFKKVDLSSNPAANSAALNTSLAAFTTSTASAAINLDEGKYAQFAGDLFSAVGNLVGAAASFADRLDVPLPTNGLHLASSGIQIAGLAISNYETLPGDTLTALNELRLQIQEGEVLIVNDALNYLGDEWNDFQADFSNATDSILNYIDNFNSPDADLYAQEALDAVNAVQGSLGVIADAEGITLEGITINIDENNNFTISTDSTLDIVAGANVNVDVDGFITDLKTTLENGVPTSDISFDEYNANITKYQPHSGDIISGIANELGISVDDLFTIADNDYLADRKFTLDNGADIYLFKDGDSLNITPADNDFEYVAYNFTDKNNTNVEVTQNQAGVGTGQDAIFNMPIPAKNVAYTDANGNTTNYFSIIGNSQEFLESNYSDLTGLDVSGISQIYDNVNNLSYIDKNSQANIEGQQVSFKSIVDMVEKGAEGFADFMTEVIKNTGGYVENHASTLIAQIVSRVIQGEDIEDIAEDIAIQTVAAGAVESTLNALGGITTDKYGNVTITDELGVLINNKALAVGAIKGAITQVAVTAIISGSEAGFEDYTIAAATGGVQRVIDYGITNSGFSLLTKSAGEKTVTTIINGVPTQATVEVFVPTPAGAGAIAAITTVASSLISGNGINEDTLRSAAVAAGTAAAGAAISTALFGSAAAGTAGLIGTAGAIQFGATALSVAGPVGIVIGAALGVLIGSIFKPGGEFHYHNESVGFVVQEVDGKDTIIVVREQGALAVADANAGDIIGGSGHDVLVGDDNPNLIVAQDGDDMLEGRGDEDILIAGAGHDHIEAGDSDDYIEGNEGNDKIHGDDGNDMIIGGSGHDVISGGTGNDQIEGNEGDDVIYGDSGDDIVWGGDGIDQINGGAGNDLLYGDAGDDYIDGSIGDDEIYGGAGHDVLFGSDGNDVVRGDSGDDIVYGDDGIDVLYGDLGDDILDGGKDADLLFGGLGKDVLFGQDGDDHIYGELDDDYLVGGKGDDILDGGDGSDVYAFGYGDGKDVVADSGGTQDIIRLANYTLDEITFTLDGNDVILSAAPDGSDEIRIVNQMGTDAIEYVMLSDGQVIDMTTLAFDAEGVAGYNMASISGSDLANQTHFAGTWQEVEEDRQYMSYNTNSSWYYNNFDTATIDNQADLELYNDVQVITKVVKKSKLGRTTHSYHHYDYFENNLMGTDGADRIVGLWWDENLEGRGGNDQLYGNGGSDNLSGGTEHDIIFGGSQNDTINANEGNDKAYGGMGNDTINGNDGNDTLFGEWGSDTINGGLGDDMISGGMDNDILSGDAGNDIIYGDQGNDTINGNDGNDYLVGGDGDDNIEGGSGDDYIEGGLGDDYLSGGDGNDILRAEDGNDTLLGGNDDDLLIGGKGADSINGGAGNDTVSYYESDASVNVNLTTGIVSGGYANGDTISNVENVIGSDYDDIITGNGSDNILEGGYGSDIISGGDGDDILQGGAGADSLDGGIGWDKVSYADSVSGVEIDFVAGTGKYGHAEGDSFTNMEHVVGSDYDDKLIVGSSTATFEAGDGYDTIVLQGNAADYEIILNRNLLTAKYVSTTGGLYAVGTLFTFPDGERLEFDDVSYGLEDFPGDGDAIGSIIENNAVNGIVLRQDNGETVTIETNGDNGTASLNPDGTFIYTPDTDYRGTDTFAVRIVDNNTGLIRIQHMDLGVNQELNEQDGIYFPSDPYFGDSGHYKHSTKIAVLSDGNTAVLYKTNDLSHNPDSLYLSIFDKFGNALITGYEVNDENSTGLINPGTASPSITVFDGNKIAVAWHTNSVDKEGVYLRTFEFDDGDLNSLTSSMKIHNIWGDPPLLYSTQNMDGFYLLSKETEIGNQKVNVSKFSEMGDLISSPIPLFTNKGNSFTDFHQLDNGNFIALNVGQKTAGVPSDGELLYGWIYSVTGEVLQNFTVNTDAVKWPGASLGASSVTQLDNGNIVVVYEGAANPQVYQNKNVYARVYNQDGIPLTNEETLIATSPDYAQVPQGVISLSDGKYAILWMSDEGEQFLNVKIFDENSNEIAFLQNINVGSDPNGFYSSYYPNIEEYDDGSFIVSWSGWYTGYGSFGIKRIVYDDIKEYGTAANDVIKTSIAGDILIGLSGADILDGGEGIDTASYEESDSGVTIDLSDTSHTDSLGQAYSLGVGGHAEGDRLQNIENVTGSEFADDITGDSAANILVGNGGDDILSGGLGDDTLDGGEGVDTAMFAGDFSGYALQLSGDNVQVIDIDASNGDEGTDTISEIEKLNFNGTEFSLSDFELVDGGILNVLTDNSSMFIAGSYTDIFTIDTAPVKGVIAFNADGTSSYQPNAGETGSDSFSYQVTNDIGLKKLINVVVDINATAVNAESTGNDLFSGSQLDDVLAASDGSDTYQTGSGNDIVVITLDAGSKDIITDFDVADDKLDLSDFDFMFDSFAELMLQTSDDGTDTTIDFGNGQTLVLKGVTKTQLTKDNFIGNVTLNALPVAALTALTVDVDEATTIDVLAEASDLDGDVITLDSVGTTTNPNATVSIINGEIVYTPESGFAGSDSFEYTVSDNQGGVVTQTLNITVEPINDAPTAITLSDNILAENVSGAIIGDITVADIDSGDIHTFTTTDARFEVVNGQLKLVDGVSLDYEDATVIANNGTISFDITATDIAGADYTETVTINVGDVAEVVVGTAANDTITGYGGGIGKDIIYGMGGNDLIATYAENDYIEGGAGNDSIYGGSGDDIIEGQVGHDILYGGEGNDTIRGGYGVDHMQGDAGIDTFVFTAIADSNTTYGIDTIHNFEDGTDLIDLSMLDASGISSFADLTVTDNGSMTTITGNSNTFELKLNGVYTIDENDFVF